MQWIDATKNPPRKDVPILIATEDCDMPKVVKWVEEGTYGFPAFFENDEYYTMPEEITFWMTAVSKPEITKKTNPWDEKIIATRQPRGIPDFEFYFNEIEIEILSKGLELFISLNPNTSYSVCILKNLEKTLKERNLSYDN